MLRWWSNVTRVAVLPDRVDVARLRYRIRPQLRDASSIEVTHQEDAPASQGAMDALRQALAQAGKGERVSIIISNAFLRLALVPWEPSLSQEAEFEAFGRHHLKLRYGDIAWNAPIALTRPRFGAAGVACTLDPMIWTALTQAVADADVRLISVEPLIGCIFDAFADRFKFGPSALAILEAGFVTFVFVDKERLGHVTTRRVSRHDSDTLAKLFAQEIAAADISSIPHPIWVYSTLGHEVSLDGVPWKPLLSPGRTMRGRSAEQQAASAVALCGVIG